MCRFSTLRINKKRYSNFSLIQRFDICDFDCTVSDESPAPWRKIEFRIVWQWLAQRPLKVTREVTVLSPKYSQIFWTQISTEINLLNFLDFMRAQNFPPRLYIYSLVWWTYFLQFGIQFHPTELSSMALRPRTRATPLRECHLFVVQPGLNLTPRTLEHTSLVWNERRTEKVKVNPAQLNPNLNWPRRTLYPMKTVEPLCKLWEYSTFKPLNNRSIYERNE